MVGRVACGRLNMPEARGLAGGEGPTYLGIAASNWLDESIPIPTVVGGIIKRNTRAMLCDDKENREVRKLLSIC